MKRLAILLALLWSVPASAATDVWIFYGAGFYAWSSGMDQIARRARTLRGVNAVRGPFDYRDTQRVYDEIVRSNHEHSIVIMGYSCGGNASLAVANALRNNNRTVHVITLQPSVWCGRYPTSSNIRYFQDTWSYGTGGLGSYQPEGPPAHYTT